MAQTTYRDGMGLSGIKISEQGLAYNAWSISLGTNDPGRQRSVAEPEFRGTERDGNCIPDGQLDADPYLSCLTFWETRPTAWPRSDIEPFANIYLPFLRALSAIHKLYRASGCSFLRPWPNSGRQPNGSMSGRNAQTANGMGKRRSDDLSLRRCGSHRKYNGSHHLHAGPDALADLRTMTFSSRARVLTRYSVPESARRLP